MSMQRHRLKRHDNGVWYIYYTEHGVRANGRPLQLTRRLSTRTTDYDTAQHTLARRIMTCADDIKDVTLGVVFARYIDRHASALPSRATVVTVLQICEDYYGSQTSLSSLTPSIQNGFDRQLRIVGRSPGYIQRIQSTMRAAINWMQRHDPSINAPFVFVRASGATRALTIDDDVAVRMLNCADERMFRYLVAMFATGARPGVFFFKTDQAHALNVDRQVDFELGTVSLNPPGRDQTKKHRPVIRLCRTLRLAMHNASGYWITSTRDNTSPVRGLRSSWAKLKRDAQLTDSVDPTTIRHFVGTELFRRRVHQSEVQLWLGHKARDMRTTERYIHADPNYLRGASEAIDAWFADIAPQVDRPLLGASQLNEVRHNG